MRAINFPDWQDVLECDGALRESDRNSYKITIRWFLSYCRRVRRPANKEQAYDFMEEACERKQPTDWVAQRWKDGINWFFSHAPKEAVDGADQRSGQECPRSDSAGGREPVKKLAGAKEANPASGNARAASGERADFEEADQEICVPGRRRGPERQPAQLEPSEPEWRLKLVKGIRIRDFSYRTEKSYSGWLERFARYWKTRDLEALGEEEIKLFLDHLAVKEQVSGETQRVALNALVFFYRDVLKRELGDFGDYKKASGKKRVPVVLSVEEIRRVLAQMSEGHRLMARLQYGAGLAP